MSDERAAHLDELAQVALGQVLDGDARPRSVRTRKTHLAWGLTCAHGSSIHRQLRPKFSSAQEVGVS